MRTLIADEIVSQNKSGVTKLKKCAGKSDFMNV